METVNLVIIIFVMVVTALVGVFFFECDRYKTKLTKDLKLQAKQRLFDEALLAEMPDTGYHYILSLVERLGLPHDDDEAAVEFLRNAIKEAANDLRRRGDPFIEGREKRIKQ